MKKGKFTVELIHTPLSYQKKTALRATIKDILKHRHAAGEVFRFSPEAGQAVRALRKAYRDAVVRENRLHYKTTRVDMAIVAKEQTNWHTRLRLVPGTTNEAAMCTNNHDARINMLADFRAYLQELRRRNRDRDLGRGVLETTDRNLAKAEPGYWYKKFRRKKIREDKKPDRTSKAEFVGIELECYVKGKDVTSEALFPFASYISIVGDGSIKPDIGYEGIEVRVIAKKSELRESLFPVLGVIMANGGKVNDSCGTHVHFDMGRKSYDETVKCFHNLYQAQNILLAMMPATRRASQYCRRCAYADFEDQARHSRYSLINTAAYKKHETLEVRLHDATLDGEELVNWIGLIHSIMANPNTPGVMTKDADEFGQLYALSPKELAYVKGRMEMFKHVPEFTDDGTPILSPELRARIGEEPYWLDGLGRWQTSDGVVSPVDRATWCARAALITGITYSPETSRRPMSGSLTAACAVGEGCPSCHQLRESAFSSPSGYLRREVSPMMPVFFRNGVWFDHIGVTARYTRASWEERNNPTRFVPPLPTAGTPFPGARDTWSPLCLLGVAQCESCRVENAGVNVMNEDGSRSYLEPVQSIPLGGYHIDHRGRLAHYGPGTWARSRESILRGLVLSVGLGAIPGAGGELVFLTGVAATVPSANILGEVPYQANVPGCTRLNCESCYLELAGVEACRHDRYSELPPVLENDNGIWLDHLDRVTVHTPGSWSPGNLTALWLQAHQRYCPGTCSRSNCGVCWRTYAVGPANYRQAVDELRMPEMRAAEVPALGRCGECQQTECECCGECERAECICCATCGGYPCECCECCEGCGRETRDCSCETNVVAGATEPTTAV